MSGIILASLRTRGGVLLKNQINAKANAKTSAKTLSITMALYRYRHI